MFGCFSRSRETLQWHGGRYSSWSLEVDDFHLRGSDPESTTKPAATFLGGVCGYWENSLADSRLDFTVKSPQRTEVALEFVQSSISAIWSQPSDSDYEHTPNGWLSFMGLCFRTALRFIQRTKQPCLQDFSFEMWIVDVFFVVVFFLYSSTSGQSKAWNDVQFCHMQHCLLYSITLKGNSGYFSTTFSEHKCSTYIQQIKPCIFSRHK